MNDFAEYMWYLLTTPFKKVQKEVNAWYAYCLAIGAMFDEIKEAFLRARDEGMIATCSDFMLAEQGKDRGLNRYQGESLDNFRKRIALYEEVCELGGLNGGILLAVRSLGYSEPQIISAPKLTNDAARWAEFYLVIQMSLDEEHPIGFDILQSTVRRWKECEAKDNYMFHYSLPVMGFSKFLAVVYGYYEFTYLCWLDGSWWLDGSVKLGDYQEDVEEIIVSEIIKTKIHTKKEAESRVTGNISPVRYIALGSGAGSYGQEKNHLAEDVQLFHEIIRKEIEDIVKLDDITYQFSITLDHEEAVGEGINEIMLVDEDGDAVLFSSFLTKTKARAEETYTIVLS